MQVRVRVRVVERVPKCIVGKNVLEECLSSITQQSCPLPGHCHSGHEKEVQWLVL